MQSYGRKPRSRMRLPVLTGVVVTSVAARRAIGAE
jgi:hypothetical protein